MSYDAKAELLKALTPPPRSVREFAGRLHYRIEAVVSLIREMEDQGLLKVTTEAGAQRGRPRHLIRATSLGEDYLAAYEALGLKLLRSRKADLRQAERNGEYAARLVSRGVSPFKLFLELNSIVGAHTGRSA